MPEADVLAAISKTSDRLDTQIVETSRIVEGLALSAKRRRLRRRSGSLRTW